MTLQVNSFNDPVMEVARYKDRPRGLGTSHAVCNCITRVLRTNQRTLSSELAMHPLDDSGQPVRIHLNCTQLPALHQTQLLCDT